MPVFDEPLEVMTPFGPARCTERIDAAQTSFWICWPKETNISFWFLNQEVRLMPDWSNKSYTFLPFELDKVRVEQLDKLGRHHTYWREHIRRESAGNT